MKPPTMRMSRKRRRRKTMTRKYENTKNNIQTKTKNIHENHLKISIVLRNCIYYKENDWGHATSHRRSPSHSQLLHLPPSTRPRSTCHSSLSSCKCKANFFSTQKKKQHFCVIVGEQFFSFFVNVQWLKKISKEKKKENCEKNHKKITSWENLILYKRIILK